MSEQIDFQEFMERCNNAPLSLEEVAETLTLVKNRKTLRLIALAYLNAREKLMEALEQVDFELG